MIQAITKMRLPLLVKDLTEAAARRRTYIVRAVFIAVASLFFLGIYWNILDRAGGQVQSALGNGADIARFLVLAMLAGIYLLLPAAMSGAVTREKESGTLSLLLVTDMGPGEIVLQKLLAGLVPVFATFALLLPFAGLAYTLGGVDRRFILTSSMVVLAAALQVGAAALLASVWSRTSTWAFVLTYVLLGGLALAAVPFLAAGDSLDLLEPVGDGMVVALTPGWAFAGYSLDVKGAFVRLVPCMVTIVFMLALARSLLRGRATVRRKRWALRAFSWLDSFWMRANRLAGNVVLVRDTDTLPDAKPLAWREVNRNSLTRFSHLLRLCLSLEGLVILVCLIGFGGGIIDLPVAVLWLVLTLGPLFMAVKAANLFAGERAAQTLSVLLTIPVSGKRIVKEKMAGLSRLHLAYLIPLATLAITVAVMKSSSRVYLEPRIAGYVPHEGAPSVVVVLVDAVVKVRALVWFSVWVGLRIKSRGRAVVLVVLIALAWRFLGPAVLYDATHGFEFGIWLITIGAHVFVLLAARYMSFRGLDEYMGRLSGEKGLLERFTEWAVGQPAAEPDGAGEEVERC